MRKMFAPKNIDYSDSELLSLILESKELHSFELLYDRYAPFVYNKCISFIRDEEVAKDLTQEIFINIYLNLNKFKGNSKLSTWIYSITVNTCIKYVNKKKREPIYIDFGDFENHNFTDIFDEKYLPEADLLNSDYLGLYDAINHLSIEDKEILLMKYQNNFPIKKIGSILNVNESAVKMRILRAKKKVSELLSKYRAKFK